MRRTSWHFVPVLYRLDLLSTRYIVLTNNCRLQLGHVYIEYGEWRMDVPIHGV